MNTPGLQLLPTPETALHLAEQQAAFDALPTYEVEVVQRETHKDPDTRGTTFGTFYQESVIFSDGAVRLVTIGEPNKKYFGKDNVCPFPISEGDPWLTGPHGLNEEVIEKLVKLGYHVVWLHHQGRHAPWPTNLEGLKTSLNFLATKSVGKSAAHDHALFNHLGKSGVNFFTDDVLRGGFSRSAMSGDAFVALAPLHNRRVSYSDLTAKCFAHAPNIEELFRLGREQVPEEIKGLIRLTGSLITRQAKGESGILKKYLGTLDPHPMNMAHELAWIPTLLSGDDGDYSRAIPLDTRGTRVFLTKDGMSHYVDHQLIHARHPNLAVLVEPGSHIEGAHHIAVDNRIDRFSRVIIYMREHNMSLTGIEFNDYLPPAELSQLLNGRKERRI